MDNIKLIYENVEPKKVNMRRQVIEINVKGKSINADSLKYIASVFKYMTTYRLKPYKIKIQFENLKFADKITYLVLDALIYDLFIRTRFNLYIGFKEKDNDHVYDIGFSSTALCRTAKETGRHIKKCKYIDRKSFIKNYREPVINKNIFRKLLTKDILKHKLTPSKIYTEVAIALKYCSEDEEWIDTISEVVCELICNVSSHTEGDCLLDVNFSNEIEGTESEDFQKYTLVNIAVINFSENNLYDKIKYNIKNNKYKKDDDLYKKVYKAYNTHKDLFNEKYDENHFFMITAFQNHVTTRSYKSGNGGTGLTRLIQNIIGKAKKDYSYTLSGENILVFKSKYLQITEDKFIGFNDQNDYFNYAPDTKVVGKTSLYIPGTIHHLLLIKENDYGE